MPRPISDEELQLKKRARRRLVGAIVLVTAVAVILPMVLDSEPRPVSQNVEIQIPSPDSGELKPKSAAAPASGSSTKAAPATQSFTGAPVKGGPESPALSGAPVKGAPATPALSGAPASPANAGTPIKGMPPAPVAGKDAAPKGVPATQVADAKAATEDAGKAKDDAKAAAKEASNGVYVVQVAALADAARVKQLQKQMTAAGVKTYTEAISTKTGEVTRVRAGPYATREAAETARSQLKKAGLDGKVVPR